jgi:hypothetical protein
MSIILGNKVLQDSDEEHSLGSKSSSVIIIKSYMLKNFAVLRRLQHNG